jgi:hypothetical protein
MSDPTLYETTVPSNGALALAHEKLIRMKTGGAFINITGDVNNLALNPSEVNQTREVYGTKGLPSKQVTGHSYAPTFAVEVVRDPVTKQIVGAQDWFVELYRAALSKGPANLKEFQLFTDAFDERMPVLQGLFSVAVAELNTGHADKGGFTFTLTSDGPVPEITSPLAGTGVPIIETVSPAGQAPGDLVKVTGYHLGSLTAATIDGQTVLERLPIDDYTLALLVPSGVSGSAPVVLTNPQGASAAAPYTAA